MARSGCCLTDRPSPVPLERLPTIASRHVDVRLVDVWLPDDDDARVARGERFAVPSLHDGQMQSSAYLRDHLADPATHRLYQDHGTTELNTLYPLYQPPVDALVRERLHRRP